MKKYAIARKLPKISFLKLSLSALTVMILNTGCEKLGPDFMGVAKVKTPQTWNRGTKRNKNEIASWWKIFNDPVLNRLVLSTYAQNLDIKSAGLRILQSRAALGISEGLQSPQVQTLSGNMAKVRSEDNAFSAAALNFDMAWEMDIWGKYARGIESSEATLYASIASYNDIMVSVIAEVARNYINYRTAQERIAYAKRNIVIQERVSKITEIQFNSGNVSELDMQQSRAQLYTTQSVLPGLELSKVKSRNAMAVLMNISGKKVEKMLQSGITYQDNISKYVNTNTDKSYIQIKEGDRDHMNIALVPNARFNPYYKIDGGLLSNRPDLKVAEYQVRANSANIGATVATLYPSFSLFGNIGLSSNDARGSWVSAGDALGVTIGPAFSWNIFQYGRIKNQIRLKDAIFEESLVNYNKKVLSALSEVSDALNGYRLTKEQLISNEKAVNATVRAFNISMTQYNDGLVSYERLLTSVNNLTRSQDQYAQIKGSLANNVMLLYKALGGGWQMSKGEAYLSRNLAQTMQKRTDWGHYLDEEMTRLPQGLGDE
ncbi:MAG: TolC family protein [Campylobacterota bacterium]|nr:TolC family protein [Campylobacterota bacterium]